MARGSRQIGRQPRQMTVKGTIKAVADIWTAYYSGLRHLFHRSYTLRFPEQRLVVEKGYRGRHLLHLDRCTGCGICAWICPEKCITIVPRGERWYPQYFYGRCCFCHFCTDYCPEYALEETVEFDLAEYTRDRLVWSPERLARPPAGKDDKYIFSVETPRGASNIPRVGAKPEK